MSAPTRRAPLASIPNAANSPHRTFTTSGSKRPRPGNNVSQHESEPPQKRQVVAKLQSAADNATPRRQLHAVEGKVFDRGDGCVENAFQKKLVAAAKGGVSAHKGGKNTTDGHAVKDLETIRQWQKHTRKAFPNFSFYFESVPEDIRLKFTKHVTNLGAHEEKFFSKSVTHIVTTRQLPADGEATKSSDPTSSSKGDPVDTQLQTINPSLLEKFSTTLSIPSKNNSLVAPGINIRRDASGTMDVLARGRQMGMKIWPAEKFNRILANLLDDGSSHAHTTRGPHILTHAARVQQEDLSQLLRSEKLGASAERDVAAITRDLVVFKGPFIYVHDMEEKARPTMVREYAKVTKRSEGEWPQFRSAPIGKCPFVEETKPQKEVDQERARERALLLQQQMEAQQVARTRATYANDQPPMNPPTRRSPRKALQEMCNPIAAPRPPLLSAESRALPSLKPDQQPSFPTMPERQRMTFARPPHMMPSGAEPTASGIQKSNVTSAIQSQMISSTAAMPGAKAGTSKEVHELKRKVLERGHTGSLSVGSIPSSHRMNDLAGALQNQRAPAPQRAAKSRAQEKLGGIQEENECLGDECPAPASRKKKSVKRDPKPGYCENCRDKYEDFDEHIASRKHRKFALTQSNWVELDHLLAQLRVP